MRRLDLTLPTPQENLALDEALLEEAEGLGVPCETLRLWQPAAPLVVVGRSSRIHEEVDLETCRRAGVPVLRRVSGGAAIVTGPGCLMYSLVLSLNERPALRAVDEAHRYILERLVTALRGLAKEACCRGTSDLALGDRKFSGNSMRVKRTHLLYHGTLLLDFPLAQVGRWLKMPPRVPEYRDGRDHGAFLTNLSCPADAVGRVLAAVWEATSLRTAWPQALTARLVVEKYGNEEWNWGR